VGVADAIADCLYILYGTALEWGLGDKLPVIFDEVHRSNMSKLGADGKPIYREDGKILKGENYTPPQIKDIVWADPE
jgi:predicted HAD superfamily Cof-like phosphohydrolase